MPNTAGKQRLKDALLRMTPEVRALAVTKLRKVAMEKRVAEMKNGLTLDLLTNTMTVDNGSPLADSQIKPSPSPS